MPKGVGALEHLARQTGAGSDLLSAVIGVNGRQRQLPLHVLRNRFGGIHRLKVAKPGLTFKPGTGDPTKAPAMKLTRALAKDGARLMVYGPTDINGENALRPDRLKVATDVLTATTGAQAAVIMTGWGEIAEADWAAVSRCMVLPRFIFDGRNALIPMTMRAAGFEYVGVGRGTGPKGC